MTQAGVYGHKLGRRLQLQEASPSLITRSLRSAELAVTETRNDDPVPDLSGSLPSEDAYLVSLKFRDYPDCERWERGQCGNQDRYPRRRHIPVRPEERSAIRDRQAIPFAPFLSAALGADGIAEQAGAPRVDELAYRLGIGHDDAVVRHIGAALLEGLRRPDETNQLFIDHMMLAFTVHVAQTYGGMQRISEPARGGLAPWQAKRPAKGSKSDLGGTLSLQQIAAEFGSRSAIFRAPFEFPPACRRTNGCFASASRRPSS